MSVCIYGNASNSSFATHSKHKGWCKVIEKELSKKCAPIFVRRVFKSWLHICAFYIVALIICRMHWMKMSETIDVSTLHTETHTLGRFDNANYVYLFPIHYCFWQKIFFKWIDSLYSFTMIARPCRLHRSTHTDTHRTFSFSLYLSIVSITHTQLYILT